MSVIDYRIIFNSDITFDIVTIKEISSTRLIDPVLEKLCRKRWREILNDAKNQRKKIWDSDVYRFESAIWKDNILQLNVSTIPFSIRLSMNNFTDTVNMLGMKYAPLGMYTSCFVVTADGQYLFIEKSNSYYSNRKMAFIGGILSKTESILQNGSDLFNEAIREIQEELDLYSIGVQTNILKAGYITENYNVCLLFEVKLNISLKDIQKNFKASCEKETANIVDVARADLSQFALMLPERDMPKFKIAGYI